MAKTKINEMLKEINIKHINLKNEIDNSLANFSTYHGAFQKFLFLKPSGYILREALTKHLLDSSMVSHRKDNFQQTKVVLEFDSSEEAKYIMELFNNEIVEAYFKTEFLISFSIKKVTEILVIKFKDQISNTLKR
ncbi:MAG: hypothetical protein JWQ09_6001 [Segetibacter sp.]|nr:hypothetical protein [Segetibacter sp.]